MWPRAYARHVIGCPPNSKFILWDGKECAMSSCCDLNKPPWFITELETDTVDDIEVRLCMDQPASDEDVAIKLWEIYVR